MYAIIGKGVFYPVDFVRITVGDQLPAGYDFITDQHPEGLVLAEDGVSLRAPTQAEIDAIANAEFNVTIDDELLNIDLSSIRALREWIAAQPDASQFVIDDEAAAQAKRSQRK